MGNDWLNKFNPEAASRNPNEKKINVSLDIKMGDSNELVPCRSCINVSRSGLFVLINGNPLLMCMKCVATGVSKWQDQHPLEKLIQTDIDVDEKALERVAKMLEVELGISSERASVIAKRVTDEI